MASKSLPDPDMVPLGLESYELKRQVICYFPTDAPSIERWDRDILSAVGKRKQRRLTTVTGWLQL